jgi:myo-inositol-1(or 4)-monophosphatase
MGNEYLSFARGLATEAGQIIRQGFERIHGIEFKADGSPVTMIDKKINREVAERIQQRYPDHELLGEECDLGAGSKPCKWICDPLDGTGAYILGIPNSVFMLAFMKDGIVQLSVVHDPFSNRLYHAIKNVGAFCNNIAIHVNSQSLSDGYVVLGANSYRFIGGIRRAGAQIETVAGSGYKSMMIARGKAVATIKDSADFHDIAPAALIVEEAGGQVTALDGTQLQLDRDIGGVIVSNTFAHRTLVDIAQEVAHH